jgi:hypothetical protein
VLDMEAAEIELDVRNASSPVARAPISVNRGTKLSSSSSASPNAASSTSLTTPSASPPSSVPSSPTARSAACLSEKGLVPFCAAKGVCDLTTRLNLAVFLVLYQIALDGQNQAV